MATHFHFFKSLTDGLVPIKDEVLYHIRDAEFVTATVAADTGRYKKGAKIDTHHRHLTRIGK